MHDLLPELQEIFRDIFDDENLVIAPESNASTVEDWDSLAHVNLVTAIEKKYKIRFGLAELQELKNVGGMIDLIKKKLAAK
jgi:acyl carrier protein